MSKGELTPLEANPLVKDDNDEPSSGMFSYRVVVIVILYVSGHTCPDVDLAVIICARYTFIPKLSHKLALNILVNYLKQTKDQGSVLNPNYGVCKVYAYPDDYFDGVYRHDNPTDTICVKIHTVFIITFVYCPIFVV